MLADPTIDQMKIVGKFRVTAPSSPAMPTTGYQMRINLSSLNQKHSISSNIPQLNVGFGIRQSNFNDLAFVMDGGVVLPHQTIIHADGSNKNLPECWVKIPFIPASQSKIVYILAGHPSANRNNGDKTFELWDDFLKGNKPNMWDNTLTASISNGVATLTGGSVLSTSKKFTATNIISRIRIKPSSVGSTTTYSGIGWSTSAWWTELQFNSTNASYAGKILHYDNTSSSITSYVSANTWSTISFMQLSDRTRCMFNDANPIDLTSGYDSTNAKGISITSNTGTTLYLNSVCITKYMATEPTITLL